MIDLDRTLANIKRKRMIFDLPFDVQMAIKLRAVKSGMTTGEVVESAVKEVFAKEVKEAQKELARGGDAL